MTVLHLYEMKFDVRRFESYNRSYHRKDLEKFKLVVFALGHQESSWRRERRLLGVMTGRGLYKSASS